MKKLLLVLAVALTATIANAQRTINWSVDTLIVADTLTATAGGTPLLIDFVMKNVGTDSVLAGDTIFYNVLLVNANNQVITGYPSNNPSQYLTRVVTTPYGTGDTAKVSLNLTGPRITQSLNAALVVQGHILRRPAIDLEPAATNANNAKGKAIVWMSEYGFGVGLKEFENVALSVYPNPASEVVNFNIDYNKAASVELMDITGRKVGSANFELNNASVDVRSYNKGIYMYQVLNSEGQVVKIGKLTVN